MSCICKLDCKFFGLYKIGYRVVNGICSYIILVLKLFIVFFWSINFGVRG